MSDGQKTQDFDGDISFLYFLVIHSGAECEGGP